MARDYEDAAYVAVPIETLEKVKELLEDTKANLYVGRTEKGLRKIEAIQLELFPEED